MYEFKDPTRLTTTAVSVTLVYMVLRLLFGIFAYLEYSSPPALDSGVYLAGSLVAMVAFVVMIACFVVVGCWIYRANANAHMLSSEMTISPGWAVGSYFIPILNLFRPFQGMKETWLASHFRGNWHGEPAPGLLGWWWALWLVVNILDNIAGRLSDAEGLPTAESAWFDVLVALLNVPLCLILVTIMRRLSEAQLAARYEETFA